MRKWFAAAAALLCVCVVARAEDQPDSTRIYYTPRLMTSSQAALKTLAELHKYYKVSIFRDAVVTDMQLSPDELRYKAVRNWEETGSEWVPSSSGAWIGGRWVYSTGGSSQSYSIPHSQEEAVVLEPRKMKWATIWKVNDSNYMPWLARVVYNGPEGMMFTDFGTYDQATAQKLADAFVTLITAVREGDDLWLVNPGMWFLDADEARSKISRSGLAGDGAVVAKVLPGSPAEAAGLKEGDILYEFFDRFGVKHPITLTSDGDPSSAIEMARAAGEQASATFVINVWRDRHDVQLSITVDNPNYGRAQLLRNNARATQVAAQAAAPAAPPPVKLGVGARDLSEVEAKAAGVAGGVLLVSVNSGSVAEAMGMKAGDILMELNGTTLSGVASMRDVLAGGAITSAKVKRNGTVLTLRPVNQM